MDSFNQNFFIFVFCFFYCLRFRSSLSFSLSGSANTGNAGAVTALARSRVNDADDDAERLVRLLKGLKCKVNLIPFNQHPLSDYRRPPRARTLAFQEILRNGGLNALIREARGDDIDAACGQLRLRNATAGAVSQEAAAATPPA